MCDCVTDIACALRWRVALIGDISIGLCAHPVVGPPFQIHERTTLLRGHEYEEGRVVTLEIMFVKYIRTICFNIFWLLKELYFELLYNSMRKLCISKKNM